MKYLHPDNRDKPYVDWRTKENRKKMFFNWLNWRIVGYNIDNYAWNCAFTETSHSKTGAPMTRKQKLWYSYLYGNTYNSPLAWVFYNHYPDYDKIDFAELDLWNRATMPRQIWETDTRYNKGHLVKMWSSFLDWVSREGKGDIEEAFDKFLDKDPLKSYQQITTQINSWNRFGRMSSWLTAQCLYECCDMDLQPDTMHADDPSNASLWNGMCYYLGEEHMTVGIGDSRYADYKPTKADRVLFKAQEPQILKEAKEIIGENKFLSYFTLESHLCQFKKLNVGYDYPGQNVGDATLKCKKFKELWPDVDFKSFEDRIEVDPRMFPNIRGHLEKKPLWDLFRWTGQPINMENLYPELPDMYKELNLDRAMMLEEKNEPEISRLIKDYLRRISGNVELDVLSIFF